MGRIADKAIRLVTEGRVEIHYGGDEIRGRVRGDSGTYEVLVCPDPELSICQCPANREGHRRCSHMIALELAYLGKENDAELLREDR